MTDPATGSGSFIGAKAAFFHGTRLLTLQRDDLPGLPWRGQWDVPGGGREGDETPEACLLRELHEEFDLQLPPERLLARWALPSITNPARVAWFFSGHITEAEIAAIRFGDEGQGWALMEVEEFLSHPLSIAEMHGRVRLARDALL
jgi:8-oxo-dGTP diphosphatase